jgi:GT2 family glycosyltransferase
MTAAPPARRPGVTVAIAVPSLNQGRFLLAALDSLLDQPEADVRIAVLDGGSADDSVAVIRGYANRLAYWRSDPDAGQAAAINEGLRRLGPAAYVGWLNADDVLVPGGLGRLVTSLEAHPDWVAAFGRAHVIDDGGQVVGEFPTRPFTRTALSRTSIICQPASLVRASAWERVGGLDESLHMCLDYDLWLRLSRLGPIGFVDELIASTRDHEATKTRTRQSALYEEAFRVLRRDLGYVPWRWCVSEAAHAWRVDHGGERVQGPIGLARCGGRAVARYLHLNGVSGFLRAVRGPC